MPTPEPITFSLVNPPAGVLIQPATGQITWTLTESDGGHAYPITVRVTDSGDPPFSAEANFTVTVNEVNSRPSLAPIASRAIHAGSVLVITNTATDADVPLNELNFTLDDGAPFGAILTNRTIFWQTTDAEADTTHSFTVRVTDDGQPPLSDSTSFAVTVVRRPAVHAITVPDNLVTLRWSAILGQRYRLQFKERLNDSAWTDVPGDIVADGLVAAKVIAMDAMPSRFFRIALVP